MYTLWILSLKSVLVGLHELRVLRRTKPTSETFVFLAFQRQALLQRTDELVRNDQQITTREVNEGKTN